MIVCHCKAISSEEILHAAYEGASTLGEIADTCNGAGTDCRSCVGTLEVIIKTVGMKTARRTAA